MKYRYLLIDNDNTLMDFYAAEHAALRETLTEAGIEPTDAVCARYSAINDALWKALERGETTHAALKITRFAQLLEEYPAENVCAPRLALRYSHYLGTHADLMPGAEAFLRRLHGQMKIVLVSNGDSVIQHNRLFRCVFTPLLDNIVISSEKGVSKPDPRLIEIALAECGCTDKTEAVMVGDSATADIPAAVNAGIDSIFVDWKNTGCQQATYTAKNLAEVEQILLKS